MRNRKRPLGYSERRTKHCLCHSSVQELNLNCHQAPQKMSFVTRNAGTGFLLTSSMLVCPCCEETAWDRGDSKSFSLQKLNCLTPFSLSLGRETLEMGLQGNSRVLPSTHGLSQLGNGGSGLSQLQIMQWDWGAQAPKPNATAPLLPKSREVNGWGQAWPGQAVFSDKWSWIQCLFFILPFPDHLSNGARNTFLEEKVLPNF